MGPTHDRADKEKATRSWISLTGEFRTSLGPPLQIRNQSTLFAIWAPTIKTHPNSHPRPATWRALQVKRDSADRKKTGKQRVTESWSKDFGGLWFQGPGVRVPSSTLKTQGFPQVKLLDAPKDAPTNDNGLFRCGACTLSFNTDGIPRMIGNSMCFPQSG